MQNELPKVAVPLLKGKTGFLVVGTDRGKLLKMVSIS